MPKKTTAKSKGKKKATKKPRPKIAVRKKGPKRPPRAPRLPGLEDSKIETLEGLAGDYAELRDRRQALTKDEHQIKAEVIKEMRKLGKTRYSHAGIAITVFDGEPDVKVKVKKGAEDGDDDSAGGDDADDAAEGPATE